VCVCVCSYIKSTISGSQGIYGITNLVLFIGGMPRSISPLYCDRHSGVRNQWSTSSIKQTSRAHRSCWGGEMHGTWRSACPTKSASDFYLVVGCCPPAVGDASILIDRGIAGICAEILPVTRNSVSDRVQCIALERNAQRCRAERSCNPVILWNRTFCGSSLAREAWRFLGIWFLHCSI